MSKYTISQAYPPSYDELQRWDREAQYFEYQAPYPNAPRGTAAESGWGIPNGFGPSNDAVEHVMAKFKRDVAGVPNHEKLLPEYKWSIISVCMAHFLWLRTRMGAEWLMRFYGVEEIPPFFDGYAYIYVSQDKEGKHRHNIELTKGGEIELRVFRRCERFLEPPVSDSTSPVVDDMQQTMKDVRSPDAQEPIAEASGDMYHWVSEQLRDWFLEPVPNKHWPTAKATRITGEQWARTLKRNDSQLFYEALDQIQLYKKRAYRLRGSDSGLLWCGGADIRAVPLQDYLRNSKQGQYSEHQIDNMFRCYSCNKLRACTPASGDHKMCSHCFGSVVQKDDRPALDWCTMRECNKCPDHIVNHGDLVNMKNRLNRGVHFPVQR